MELNIIKQGGKSVNEDDQVNCSKYNSDYTKAYNCNFCKKGFSNAQALGGHMNIHRRDRAKLRKTCSDDDLQSKSSDHVDIMVQELPLLVQSSSARNNTKMMMQGEGGIKSKNDSPGLDLELRLGRTPSSN
ncbi:unnamed protein product [Amaranthus hypochondriacus]